MGRAAWLLTAPVALAAGAAFGPAFGQASPPPWPNLSPPAPADSAYDRRLRQSFAAAERFQGGLDGGWRAIGAHGQALLALQLVDDSRGHVDGAWRDLLAGPTPAASGLLDRARVSEGRVGWSFEGDGFSYRLQLQRGADGVWRGRFVRGGETFEVRLEKISP